MKANIKHTYAEKEAKRYFKKYFHNCYLTETDLEFKALVRLINRSIRKSI